MGQIYKVYYKAKFLVINKTDKSGSDFLESKISEMPEDIHNKLKILLDDNDESDKLTFETCNPEQAFAHLLKHFKLIESAGGLIANEFGEIIMIYRLKHWDLPKGKIDKGETPEEAALREVSEECGIPKPEIVDNLPQTYHIYRLDSEWIIKRTYWFLMKGEKNWKLMPQTTENIEEIDWVSPSEFDEKAALAYPAIADLLKFYKENYI